MRVIRVHSPGQVAIDTLPDPTPGPRDVVVRVHACGVCGSDLGYIKRGGIAGPSDEPLALGHEMSGVVDAVGAEVISVKVGDRVVVHPGDDHIGRIGNGGPEGGLADLLLVREADRGRLLIVPHDIDLTYAALTETVAVGLHAAERLELGPGAKAVIMGAGPIGMSAVAALLDQGASSVVAVDPSPKRREITLALGAKAAFDPTEPGLWDRIREVHGADPVWSASPASHGYLETTGVADVLTQIVANAAPRARVSIPAVYLDDVNVSILLVMMKELEIRGAIEYPHLEDAFALIRRRDLSPMLTNLVDLDTVARLLPDGAAIRAAGKTIAVLGSES